MSAHQSECILQSACFMHSDTTNIDQSVAEWLKNVVEGAEATGHPLEHVFFEEGEQCNWTCSKGTQHDAAGQY